MRRNVLPASRVAPLLFFSGACALVYQVAWLKELRLVFGASTAASAAVLAVFMGGLGVGGVVLGRKVEGQRDPLMFYAKLEGGVGVAAAVTPFIVLAARSAYLATGGSGTLGSWGATLVRLLLTAVILGLPTYLMGGTLPAAARAVTKRADVGRSSIGLLYGVNTLGAVAGALAANFLMLEIFGTRFTLWIAALVNILVAMIARAVARSAEPEEAPAAEAAAPAEAAEPVGLAAWVPLAAAGIAGFAFLLMELVWYRMLAPVLGGSSYTFGLILAVALLGIGLGGALYARRPGHRAPTIAGFAVTCALEALFLGIPYALGDRIAVLALLLRPLGALGLQGHVGAWAVIASSVVLPAAIVSGYQFPLVIGLFGGDSARVARHVGTAYAANTLGSIVGSLAGGFGLIPFLGALGCWRLAGWLLAGSGLVAAGMGSRKGGRGALVLATVVCLLAAVSFRAEGPTAAWRHSPIGAGRAEDEIAGASTNSLLRWRNDTRRSLLWEQDGVESTVALVRSAGDTFVVNGKADGNAVGDAPTQVMSGLIGAALHGSPRRSLVIGLGTGSTAGWLAQVPSMERVDVLELEPAILRVARDCSPVNENVLDNPKVHIALGDARELVLVGKDQYDVVFSEPSNPYRAGISSLYTREFYEAVASRLSPDGLFIQWVQLYEVDGRAIRTAVATLHSVFPHVDVWQTMSGDALFIATKEARHLSLPVLRERLAKEPYRRAMIGTWGTDDAEGFLAHFVAGEDLWRAVDATEDQVSTDDQNHLEYAFARTVGRGAMRAHADLLDLARAAKLDRPPVTDLDLARLARRRTLRQVSDSDPPPPDLTPAERRWGGAIAEYLSGNLRAPLTRLRAEPRPLETPFEKEMIAECRAAAGDENGTLPLVEEIRGWSTSTADAILARLRRTQKRPPMEVGALLVAAFEGYRSQPFARRHVLLRALQLASKVGAADPAAGRQLFEALGPHFAAGALDDARKDTRLAIAGYVDRKGLCVEALRAFEPHVRWDRTFLDRRYACYHLTGDPLEARAEADLLNFVSSEMPSLGAPGRDDAATQPPPSPVPSAAASDERGAPAPVADAGGE